MQADITDIKRHFEFEVPLRAFFNPIIRYAICAFSSRHINRAQGGHEAESLHYHNKCLEMLIPILSNLDRELTEEILAAVAILRLDEEMEGASAKGIDVILADYEASARQLLPPAGHNSYPQSSIFILLWRWAWGSHLVAVLAARDLCVPRVAAAASNTGREFRSFIFLKKERRSKLG